MAQIKISNEIKGLSLGPIPISWDQDKTILYALAVGAKPDTELQYIYEGKGPSVLPTYGVVPGLLLVAAVLAKVEINLAMLLHGEQSITLHRPIPPNCKGTIKGKIAEVYDKGKAAVIIVEGVACDEEGDIFSVSATIFIRGAGNFGGERGPSTQEKNKVPDRAADFIINDQTDITQAALYRLTGDKNPIHIDPDFAKLAGFEKPFLHGLCTYGFAGRAVLQALCGGKAENFLGIEARFADRVEMGDELITKIWQVADGQAILQCENQNAKIVLSQARVKYKS